MNGQYLCGRPISVSYALKKDSKADRHGSAAERLLAANNPLALSRGRPHMMFSAAPNSSQAAPPMYPPPSTGMMAYPPPPPPGYSMGQHTQMMM